MCTHKKKQDVMAEILGASRTKSELLKVVLFNWPLLRRYILSHQSGGLRGTEVRGVGERLQGWGRTLNRIACVCVKYVKEMTKTFSLNYPVQ